VEYIVLGVESKLKIRGGNHMSYTHSEGQPQGAARHFVNKLREILIADPDNYDDLS